MKRLYWLLLTIPLIAPVFALAWLVSTESGLRWAYQLTDSYLPNELHIASIEGRLIGPIIIKGIEYQQDGTSITSNQITLEWTPTALLAANIDINRLHVHSLKINLPESEKSDQALTLPDINLPWRLAVKDLVIDDLTIRQNEQLVDIHQIKLTASALFGQIDIEALDINAETFSLSVNGDLSPTGNYDHKLETRWRVELPSTAIINGYGQLTGNMKMTQVKQRLTGSLQLTLEAEIQDLLTQLQWQTKINVSAFDSSKLNPDWPAVSGKLNLDGKGDITTATLSGKLAGNYPEIGPFDSSFSLQRLNDNVIQIDNLMLHLPANKTRVNVSGQWIPGPDGGDTNLALHWQNLRWPLKDTPWFDSAIGSGWIDGNINHYRIGLATDRLWPQVPPSDWYASAEGNLDGLNFHSLRVNALEGETTVTGPLSWSPQLTWQAKANISAIDPSNLWPNWPGKLNAILTSNGGYQNDQLFVNADISKLTGKLRGYPVSLSSRINWSAAGLDIHHFDFHSGTSQVNAKGHVGETVKLDWSIAASNLAELYPQAQGQLQAEGHLTGSQEIPLINASIKGSALSLLDYEIGNIEGVVVLDLFHWQQININLAAQSLNLKGYALQSLDVKADTHQLTTKVVSAAATAVIALKGEADAKGWRGHIEQVDIQSQRFSNWKLTTPVALNISENTLMLETLCLNNKDANFCAQLQRKDKQWQSNLDIHKLPLSLLGPWLPPDMKIEGVANARAELQLQLPEQLLAHAQIELTPGVISYPLLEGERDRWEYRAGNVEITVNEKGLHANSAIALTNGDRFNGSFALPGAKLLSLEPQTQPLQASARLNINDLGIIEALIPEIFELRGEVDLNLNAAGTLAQPNLSGSGNLHNGALQIPRLGLNIDHINLKSQSEGSNIYRFRLDARSGDGNLTVAGKTALNRAAGWPTEFSIKGKEFEVSRIPEARVLVSPDLQLKIQKQTLDIKGNVHIPFAKLQPKDISSAARVSDDTVILGGEQAKEEKWSITTAVRVTLGERVNFFGFGFEGRFGGSLLLEDEPGQLTKATGEINIPEGRYRAYGQRLDVEHGRLLYTGGPVTNPGLDLRAVRRVNTVTAGLKVKGSLNQPQIELFAIPSMSETDALAYMLLGRPVENATGDEGSMMAKAALAIGLSGGDQLARKIGDYFGLDEMRVESSDTGDQSSLVIGRYLSPKLYVSYGVGLIESVNTFSARYQITDKWQLKGESGEHQGADLLYTFER